MSYDWSQFLKLAENLHNDPHHPGPREASQRSAVSRAYYAAFHLAVELACSENPQIRQLKTKRDPSIHRETNDHFLYSKDMARKKLGSRLNALRTKRNQADYDETIRGSMSGFSKGAIEEAQKLIGMIGKLKK